LYHVNEKVGSLRGFLVAQKWLFGYEKWLFRGRKMAFFSPTGLNAAMI
jgi:hypothetical protein